MPVRLWRGHAPARRALQESVLHEKGLVDLLDRVGIFADGRTDRAHAHRPAVELLDDRAQDSRIHLIEPELVHVEHRERLARDVECDVPLGLHLRIVPHAAQQSVRHTRCSSRPARELVSPARVDPRRDHRSRAMHDLLDLVHGVVVHPQLDPEARAQRSGEHPEPRRRADQREGLDRHGDRLRLGALGEPDVDLPVLHGRVEELVDDRPQAVDLVDEQDVAGTQVGERPDQITRLLERRPGRGVDVHAHFARDQLGECGLAQTRRADQQRVVERFLSPHRRIDIDAQRVLHLALSDELGEPLRTQRELDD